MNNPQTLSSAQKRWANRDKSPIERFWTYVKKGTDEECWPWQGGCDNDGYGHFHPGIGVVGRSRQAHRWLWQELRGEIPDEMTVCHTCDNPPCCNPAHLFLGTHKDNVRDCAVKKRRHDQKGSSNNGAKLTEDQVREIRRRYTGKYGNLEALNREFGYSDLSPIVHGKAWKHVV